MGENHANKNISQSFPCGGNDRHGACLPLGAGARRVEGSDDRAANAGPATTGHGAAAPIHHGLALRRAATPGRADRGQRQPDVRDCKRSAAEDRRPERRERRQGGCRFRADAVAQRLGGRVEVAHCQAGQDYPGYAGAVAERPESTRTCGSRSFYYWRTCRNRGGRPSDAAAQGNFSGRRATTTRPSTKWPAASFRT